MFSLIFYSHTDYSDVWDMMFKQTDKYLPNQKKYLFTNKKKDNIPQHWSVIVYDENLPYQKRFSESLKLVQEQIVLFNHEDMILYDQPDLKELEILSQLVYKTNIDIIKLIKAEYFPTNNSYYKYKYVFENPDNLYFAIQPSICKKDKLLQIYESTNGKNIWEFETNASIYAKINNIKSCMYFKGNEIKKGMFHWESKVFPYTATAIVKGKWNLKEYSEVLEPLFVEHKIDKNIRGVYD